MIYLQKNTKQENSYIATMAAVSNSGTATAAPADNSDKNWYVLYPEYANPPSSTSSFPTRLAVL